MMQHCFRAMSAKFFISILLLIFYSSISVPLEAFPLENDDIIIAVSTDGRLATVADSSDNMALNVFRYATENPNYQNVIKAFKQAQEIRLSNSPTDTKEKIVQPLIITITTQGYYGGCNPGPFVLTRNNGDGAISTEELNGFPRTDINRSVLSDKAGGSLSGYAKLILAHETGHSVLWECYGRERWPNWSTFYQYHTKGTISDEGFAFNEGWAEGFDDHFSGKNRILTHVGNVQYKFGKDETKLEKTEGVIADFIFTIARSKKIENGYEKMVNVLAAKKPDSVDEFVLGFLELYPQDADALTEIVDKSINDPLGDVSAKIKGAIIKSKNIIKSSTSFLGKIGNFISGFFSRFGKNKKTTSAENAASNSANMTTYHLQSPPPSDASIENSESDNQKKDDGSETLRKAYIDMISSFEVYNQALMAGSDMAINEKRQRYYDIKKNYETLKKGLGIGRR